MSNLESKLQSWLEKSGYPLEMRVARAFSNYGYSVESSTYYEDPVTNKHREIDVDASKFTYADEARKNWFQVSFVIECKNSKDKPWVLFQSEHEEPKFSDDATAYRHANNSGHVALLALSVAGLAKTNPLLMRREHSGYGLVRAFGDQSDVAYSAVMSACNACTAKAAYVDKNYNANGISQIQLYFPVVVVSGQLFRCWLEEDSPKFEELTEGALVYKNPDAGEHLSTVEIVTEDGLENFLSSRDQWVKSLIADIDQGVGPLRKFLNKKAGHTDGS